jgi:hypothetical protein
VTDGAEIWGMRGWKEVYRILGQFFTKLLKIPSLAAKDVTEFVGYRQEEGQSTMFGHERLAKHFADAQERTGRRL